MSKFYVALYCAFGNRKYLGGVYMTLTYFVAILKGFSVGEI